MRGKTIKLYIMSSEYKNLKSAELIGWTGKAYIGERKHIPVIQNIEELQGTGIYFLISKDDETNSTSLYIGETDGAAKRLKDHLKKDWWNTFVVFINQNSNLTKAHVRYLEKNLWALAKSNLTTIDLLDNSKAPTGSNLPSSDIDDMDDFEEKIIFVLNNLGIIDFTKTKQVQEAVKSTKNNTFYLSLTKDRVGAQGDILRAKMIINDNGYLLLKGSYIESEMRDSFKTHTYFKLRDKIEKSGYFDKTEINGILTTNQDIPFSSPSAAAAVVKNRAVNGRSEWKLFDSTTLEEFEAR